jgi:hypothetical protein
VIYPATQFIVLCGVTYNFYPVKWLRHHGIYLLPRGNLDNKEISLRGNILLSKSNPRFLFNHWFNSFGAHAKACICALAGFRLGSCYFRIFSETIKILKNRSFKRPFFTRHKNGSVN